MFNKNKKFIFLFFAILLSCIQLFAKETSESAMTAFVEGVQSYSDGDWASAQFMLKKAVAYEENLNPDTYYMLISSEINSGDNKSALDDCEIYLESFPNSIYESRIQYHKGRILYNLGEYEKSIIALSDFCHQNEDDDMYAYALYYIGESLFSAYKYEQALGIYQRIVDDYPECKKYDAAKYRIESILQRSREEKLLYLLKQTGEEYLSAKEDYEKQLRLLNAENSSRQRLANKDKGSYNKYTQGALDENGNYYEFDKNQGKTDDWDIPNLEPYEETSEQLRVLKLKALRAQQLLDEKLGNSR